MYRLMRATLVVVLILAGSTTSMGSVQYSTSIPPFLVIGSKPNVLVVLDTSNSFDEDFLGNAVGSWSNLSKSYAARSALLNIFSTNGSTLRVGLMTFQQYINPSFFTLASSAPFISYDPTTYCPNAPDACVTYCQQPSNTTARAACLAGCQVGNPTFDPDIFDEIIDNSVNNPVGSEVRNRYCNLTYPKTKSMLSPYCGSYIDSAFCNAAAGCTWNAGTCVSTCSSYTSPASCGAAAGCAWYATSGTCASSNIIYYKATDPLYSPGTWNLGTLYCYDDWYTAIDNDNDSYYNCYTTKSNTSNGTDQGFNPGGYGNLVYWALNLAPTDSDYAYGFDDFGVRWVAESALGPTWFAGESPGGGYLNAQVSDLVDQSGNYTTTYTTLTSLLYPFNYPTNSGDQAGYMACSAADMNACPYVVNAGNTPSVGTLTNAASYFQGTFQNEGAGTTFSSPIQVNAGCQQNYIVFVTDGLPDTNANGSVYPTAQVDSATCGGFTTQATCTASGNCGWVNGTTCVPLSVSDVIGEITALRSLSYNSNTYNIETFVLGVGLTADAQANLDQMAIAGGTAGSNGGHAYYANNATEMQNALTSIFQSVTVSSGSAGAVATVTQQVTQGDIILRAAFGAYSATDLNPKPLVWKGHMESYWGCSSCGSNATESACAANAACTCVWSNNQCQPGYAFQSGGGAGVTNPTFCADFHDTTCWDAGTIMAPGTATAGARRVFTFLEGTQSMCANLDATTTAGSCTSVTTGALGLGVATGTFGRRTQVPFTASNAVVLSSYLNNNIDFYSCSSYTSSTSCTANLDCAWNNISLTCGPYYLTSAAQTIPLIDWVLGDPNCGSMGTTPCEGTVARNRESWVLGDVIYSTPVLVTQPSLANVREIQNFGDCNADASDPCGIGTCPSPSNACNSTCTTGCYNECCVPSKLPCTGTCCANQCWACFRDAMQYRKQMVYVGGNDGMVHAFVVGKYDCTSGAGAWVYDNKVDAEIGTEKWAYIPSNFLSSMDVLANIHYGQYGSVQHRYAVDLSPVPKDVFISVNGGPRQWRTVIVGGEREGGDVYFAIDVTDPDNPIVLWEYPILRNLVQMNSSGAAFMPYVTPAAYSTIQNMPVTYSTPAIGALNIPSTISFTTQSQSYAPDTPSTGTLPTTTTWSTAGGSNSLSGWYVFLGGGVGVYDPSSVTDWPASFMNCSANTSSASCNGDTYCTWSTASNTCVPTALNQVNQPYFAVIDIENGVNIFQYLWPAILQGTVASSQWTPQTSANNTNIPYSTTGVAAVDTTGSGYVNRVYFGDLNGQLYSIKFNMSTSSTTGNGMKIDVWTTPTISSSLTPVNDFRSSYQPITALPAVAFNSNQNLELFVGTGKFDTVVGANDDKSDPATMGVYSLTDSNSLPDLSGAGASATLGNSSSLPSSTAAGFTAGGFSTLLSFNGPILSSTSFNWSYTLQSGERVLESPLVAGGLVFFTTFTPSTNYCNPGGVAYLYAFNMDFSSAAPADPFALSTLSKQGSISDLQLNQYGDVTASVGGTSKLVGYKAMIGTAVPSSPILESSGQSLIVQTSDAQIHQIPVTLPTNPTALEGWIEQ